MTYRGFTLFELVISLTLFMLIVTLSGHILTAVYKATNKHMRCLHATRSLSIGLDRVLTDVAQASCKKSLWKKADTHEVIFTINKTDCGWLVRNNKLVRVTGFFDKQHNTWHKKVTSIVTDTIKNSTFKFVHRDNDTYSAVLITLDSTLGSHTLECWSVLKRDYSFKP